MGSRFWFSLPFIPVTAGAADKRSTPTAGVPRPEYPNLAELRVLVAEDNPVNQMVIVGHLKKYRIEPILVENGRLALEYCEHHPAAVDLILMDGEMPDVDGWRAAEAIRQMGTRDRLGAPVPIFAMTAHALDTYEEKAQQHGMNGFLAKPIDPQKLQRILLNAHVNTCQRNSV
jgi:CheY-like chemotaxis protein